MSLIEKVEAQVDADKAKELEQKLRKSQLDFNDYLDQMQQMKNMGGFGEILKMLPGMGLGKLKNMPEVDEKQFDRIESIILSMTPQERANPDLMNPSRKNRIAKGAGVDISEVNRLIKQFDQSRKMMKQIPGMMGGKAKRGKFKLPF